MMMAMRFIATLSMILILGLGTARAAERPVVTIETTGYGLIEECPAEGPRDHCYNEHISIPVRINIGEEIEVDLSQIGVVIARVVLRRRINLSELEGKRSVIV